MQEPQMAEITRKLSEIWLTTSEVINFVDMRFMMEEMERRSAEGDQAAQELVSIVDKFHRLCKYIEQKG